MADAANTLYYDLLARLSAIDEAISLTDYGLTMRSVPYYYAPMNKGPFPISLHRISGIQTDSAYYGPDFWREVVTISKLVVAGPVGAGYTGVNEGLAYKLIRPVLNTYYARPRLPDPTTGAAFNFLVPGENVRISAPSGVSVVGFDPGSEERFFAVEFVLECSFKIKQGRVS